MKLLIKNEYGSFEVGGGSHPKARIKEISGLGPPTKEATTVTFAGQPGHTTRKLRDLSRTITISCDFFGEQRDIERLYHMIYYPVELYFRFGTRRRKIKGVCINPEEVGRIIYQREYSIVLQFVCDNPYFSDFYNTKIAIFQRENQLPNYQDSESGEWRIQLPAVATVRTTVVKITNSGEVETYPIIHIYNRKKETATLSEVSGIEIINHTNNAKIILNYDPKEGEEITVDLMKRKIVSNLVGNITNKISDDTVLSNFVLSLGENSIECINYNSSSNISAFIEYTNNYAMAVMK